MRDVMFDLDGTLTDSVLGIVRSLQYALAQVRGPSWRDEDLQRLIGHPLREVFETLLGSDDPALNEQAIRAYRERFGTHGMYENAVYPGVPEALSRLRDAGLRLWVVTSKPQFYAERIVGHFALRELFVRVHGSELSGERADKAELIGHVLRQEQLDGAHACMIGDRRHDVAGARAHGLSSLGVLWGYGSREELEVAGAMGLVQAPAGLPSAVSLLSGAPAR
jgi:phosphoglycolate phosphatase